MFNFGKDATNKPGGGSGKQFSDIYNMHLIYSKMKINTNLKLEIRVTCREFLVFKDVVIPGGPKKSL